MDMPPTTQLQDAVRRALKTLTLQNERIEAFHSQSVEWHKQHHAVLEEIMQVVKNKQGEQLPNPQPPQTAREPTASLDAVVDRCLARNDSDTLREALQGIGLAQWKSIGEARFARLLPYLTTWLNHQHTSRHALSMVYEGIKLWGGILSHHSMGPAHTALVEALQLLGTEPSDIQADVLDLLRVVEGLRAW